METTPTVMGRRGACDIEGLTFTTGGDAEWFAQTAESNYGGDAAQSGGIGDDEEVWMETTVEGQGTLTFWYKLSCDANDGLNFFTDGQYRWGRTGNKDWDYYSYVIYGSGSHTVRWSYTKDSTSSSGSDCAWVDHIQWSGDMPDPNGGEEIAYVYDPAGRRIEKKVDGATQVKYVYDGDNCIAEYDGSNSLLRKYIHGPAIDEPICMIEVADANAVSYYHFDALGSVIALSDDSGDTEQVYEYSVYGQVAASDPNHPNRFMFTGREFDADTGLYYYRARYYNPYIGRFLQTDPIGYEDSMNINSYCGNNPVNCFDPTGTQYFTMSPLTEGVNAGILIRFTVWDDLGNEWMHYDACGVDDGCRWLRGLDAVFSDEWVSKQDGIKLAGDELTFWYLQAINQLGGGFDLKALEDAGYHIVRQTKSLAPSETGFDPLTKRIIWGTEELNLPSWQAALPWETMRDGAVAFLAHELQHAADQLSRANLSGPQEDPGTDSF